MEKNIFIVLQPDLMERLKGSLSEEKAALAEEYHSAVSATMCLCELLAYRQGMRDMADILCGK